MIKKLVERIQQHRQQVKEIMEKIQQHRQQVKEIMEKIQRHHQQVKEIMEKIQQHHQQMKVIIQDLDKLQRIIQTQKKQQLSEKKEERDLPKTGTSVASTIGAGLAFIGAGFLLLFRRKKANR